MLALLVAGTLLGPTACAKDDEPAPPHTVARETAWAIHVYVGDGEARKRVDFAPVVELSGASSVSGVAASGGAGKKSTIGAVDGSVELSTDPSATVPYGLTGWGLLWGAAKECNVRRPVVPPWSGGGASAIDPGVWYVFPDRPTTCHETLVREQQLVCMADKLKEVADAVSPLRWQATADDAGRPADVPAGAWTIPVQSSKDKFIARDLAIHTLAHLARLDARIPEGQSRSCARDYGQAASSAYDPLRGPHLYGASDGELSKAIPPFLTVSLANARQLALARLSFETHTLLAGERMLHDLIRESVFADLAGAGSRSGQVVDRLRGNLVAWGQEDAQAGGYNSLAHAVRVLTGRWEIGGDSPLGADPACGGVRALDALSRAYGDDLSARFEDLPLASSGQVAAVKLVESSGIVVPADKLTEATVGDLKRVIKDQLLVEAAKPQGLDVSATNLADLLGDQGKAIASSVDEMQGADLRFALERTLRTYRLLTNERPNTTSMSTATALVGVAGLYAKPVVAGSLKALGGNAFDGGLGRGRIPRDVIARAGGLLETSQCNPVATSSSASGIVLFADTSMEATNWPSGIKEVDKFDRATFQDAFAIAQTLQKRIAVISRTVAPGGGTPAADAEPIAKSARAGIGELRAWAGPGRVISYFEQASSVPDQFTRMQVLVADALPEDLGISTEAEAKERFTLVYGAPWTAECAARQRDAGVAGATPASCAAGITKLKPASVMKITTDSFKDSMGVTGEIYLLNFNFDPSAAGPMGRFRGASTPNEHYYLVLDSDPAAPGTRGLVLGSIAARMPSSPGMTASWTSFAFSRMQRELLNAVLGIDDAKAAYAPEVGESSSAVGPDFCVDGLRRDLFVPLENELTSDADPYENSWKHYLTLAKMAAERADSLGQQLVSIGLQSDLRRETAAESLAEFCGDPTALSKITVSPEGKVMPPSSSDALAACLGEDSTDVVFLTDDPTAALSGETKKNFLRQVLDCPGATGPVAPKGTGARNPLCDKLEKWDGKDPTGFKTAGLGIAPSGDPPVVSDCKGVLDSSKSIFTKFNGGPAADAISEPWADLSALQTLARSLRVTVNAKGDWSLTAAGGLVMSSLDPTMWPACLRDPTASGKAGCNFENATIRAWNDSFRGCDSPDRESKPLGGCDAGFFDADKEQAEMNLLRWRVEGAVWLLQASTGTVPEGAFSVPVPVSRETGAAIQLTKWTSTGSFAADASRPGFFRLLSASADDVSRSVTANIQAVDPSFAALTSTTEYPAWWSTLYGSSALYHAEAKNQELKSNFDAAKAYLKYRGEKPSAGLEDVSAPGFDRTGWRAVLTMASGTKCEAADRTETSVAIAKRDLVGLIAALKRNITVPIDASSIRKQRVMAFEGGKWSQKFRTARGEATGGAAYDTGATAFEVGSLPTETPWTNDEAHWCHDVALISGGSWADDGRSPTVHEPNTTSYAVWPTAFDPTRRVVQFVNSGAPCQSCSATRQALQALAIGCVAQRGLILGEVLPEQPKIERPEDIIKLETWLAGLEKKSKAQLSHLYIERLPDRVLADFRKKSGAVSGSKIGSHGDKIVEISDAVQSLPLAWQSIAFNLAQARDAIRGARLKVAGIDIAGRKELISLEIQQLRVYGQIVQAVSSHIASYSGVANPFGWFAVAGTSIAATGSAVLGASELDKIADLKALKGDGVENQVAQAMHDLRVTTTPIWYEMEKALGNVRSATNRIQLATSQLDRLEKRAQYEAAKGTGADFYEVDGKPVAIPVNTVLNRQYDGVKIRYERALADAKRLAYIARRAIEQRIGVPLKEIDHKVGPMDAPVSWADRVCRLQGIKYDSLRLPEGVDGGAALSPQTAAEFADAFVGDYVEMLANFVEYYNLHYPSHDGDDTAILSLKNDLLVPVRSCMVDSANLLFYSGQLHETVSAGVVPIPGDHRWRYHACPPGSATCVQALSGALLMAPDPAAPTKLVPLAPPPETGAAISWLVDRPVTAGITGAGTAPGPAGFISQSVELTPGDYVLSWWDESRASDGAYSTAPGRDYRVGVMTSTGGDFKSKVVTPFSPSSDGTGLWSPRQSLKFTVTEAGTYAIAFAASAGTEAGSVAIANVQLEIVAPGAGAGTYQATGATRRIVTDVCPETSSVDLRSAFSRKCEASVGCYYDLRAPILIETATLKNPSASLAGKLARGNFNYRHIDVSLNLVGTGVRDCTTTPTSSCYGTGFVEYTLAHDATRAPIIDWEGKAWAFDFSVGRVEHAKALAAERFITMPLGAADASLLAQPGITKMELRGRPLDGNYRLRIWDTPALQWHRLEDVQLILKYRYWSRIDRQSKG